MSNQEKIYCGTGRIINGTFGQLIKISMHRDDLKKIAEYMNNEKSDWVNLELKEKKNKGEGKATHYLQVDTWKPNMGTLKADAPTPAPVPALDPIADALKDELPF